MLKGKRALSDAELLAILVGSGTREDSAVEVCKKLLATVGNDLGQLAKLAVEDILRLDVKGIGKARAIAIVAALELGRRKQGAGLKYKGKILSSRDVFELMSPLLGDHSHEEFHVIFLNRSNSIIAQEPVSKGGFSGTVADVRMIFQRALTHRATGVIACHNHPSGSLKPSPQDVRLTQGLVEAGKVMDISLLDHVIVTATGYYSFADDGKIP